MVVAACVVGYGLVFMVCVGSQGIVLSAVGLFFYNTRSVFIICNNHFGFFIRCGHVVKLEEKTLFRSIRQYFCFIHGSPFLDVGV